MDNERTAIITIGGEEYDLVLTTRATKQIAGRYGGLENLGDKLMKSENFELAISEIVWLITLLANQSILIHNLRHADDKKDLLTEENVELLTTPADLASYNGLWTHFVIAMDTKHGHTQIIQSLFPMVVATLISVIVHSSIAQQNDDIFATQTEPCNSISNTVYFAVNISSNQNHRKSLHF